MQLSFVASRPGAQGPAAAQTISSTRGAMGAPRPIAIWTLLLLGLAGCQSTDPQSEDAFTTGARILTIIDPPHVDVGMATGSERILRVRYTDTSLAPIPGAKILFAIFGDPRGSTLSADAGLTNTNGEAEVRLRSGAASCRFNINVSAPEVDDDVIFYIEVSDAGFGAVAVQNSYDGAQPAQSLVWAQYNLYGDIQCSSIDPASPPPPLRERLVAGIDKTVQFGALPLNLDHSLLVFAKNSEYQPVSAGCINIPSSILKVDQQLTLTLSLKDLPQLSAGSYALTSSLTLNGPAAASHRLAMLIRPWADLSDCALDPAQLIVDCILDAVEEGPAADCVVDSLSPLVQSLQAPRGKLNGVCRGELTDQGAPSFEAQLAALLDKEGRELISALAEVPDEAAALLNHLAVHSTLVIHDAAEEGHRSLSHRLDAIDFMTGDHRISFEVNGMGVPRPLAWPILGKIAHEELGIDEHRLSLPLIQLGMRAVDALLLEPRALPPAADLATHLFELFTVQKGNTTLRGCSALDHLLCKAAQLPEGCLGETCPAGMSALTHMLSSAAAAPATGSIIMSGRVKMLDTNGDRKTDQLGDETAPGLWETKIDLGDLVFPPGSSTFTGARE